MHDIIKIVESPENSGLLIECATKTVKPEIKNQEGRFLAVKMALIAASLIAFLASLFIQPVTFSLLNAISVKNFTRAGKRQESGILPLLALPLLMKNLGREVRRKRI